MPYRSGGAAFKVFSLQILLARFLRSVKIDATRFQLKLMTDL